MKYNTSFIKNYINPLGSIYRQLSKKKKHTILCMQHSNSKKAKIIYKVLGEVIKEERENQSKSQRILADEFDIQKSLISRIENGVNEPKLVSIWTICNALDITIYDLLERVCKKLPDDFTLIDN